MPIAADRGPASSAICSEGRRGAYREKCNHEDGLMSHVSYGSIRVLYIHTYIYIYVIGVSLSLKNQDKSTRKKWKRERRNVRLFWNVLYIVVSQYSILIGTIFSFLFSFKNISSYRLYEMNEIIIKTFQATQRPKSGHKMF